MKQEDEDTIHWLWETRKYFYCHYHLQVSETNVTDAIQVIQLMLSFLSSFVIVLALLLKTKIFLPQI